MTMRGYDNPQITPEEAKAMAAEAMRETTCAHCGYDPGDAKATRDELGQYESRFVHDCPRHQMPPAKPMPLCDDCAADHDPEAEYRQQKRESDTTFVMFECGIVESAETPEPETITENVQVGWENEGEPAQSDAGLGEPIYEEKEIELPRQDTRPRIPAHCECGAPIDEVMD